MKPTLKHISAISPIQGKWPIRHAGWHLRAELLRIKICGNESSIGDTEWCVEGKVDAVSEEGKITE